METIAFYFCYSMRLRSRRKSIRLILRSIWEAQNWTEIDNSYSSAFLPLATFYMNNKGANASVIVAVGDRKLGMDREADPLNSE